MNFFLKFSSVAFFFLLTFLNTSAQTQLYPSISIDGKYVRDTTKFKYPVSNIIIKKNGQVYLYGRGTRYPTLMRYNKKLRIYYTTDGLIMTSRPDNVGYHNAYYELKKTGNDKAILKIKKENASEEEVIYIRSQLPVKYPTGN